MQQARRIIDQEELPAAVRRSAWLLYVLERKRINPETSRRYTARQALDNVLKWMAGQKVKQSFRQLTPTEQRVIRLIVEGMTQKQVALELDCDRETVKFHMKNVRRKLNLPSTYQVIAVAVDRGWVKAPRIDD